MHFRWVGDYTYHGHVEPGNNCLVPRDGKMTYLVSEVEVGPDHWSSRDQGFDPDTHTPLWGSEHGILRFNRIRSLADHLDNTWLRDAVSES